MQTLAAKASTADILLKPVINWKRGGCRFVELIRQDAASDVMCNEIAVAEKLKEADEFKKQTNINRDDHINHQSFVVRSDHQRVL